MVHNVCFLFVLLLKVLVGILLTFHVPTLDPYPGYTPVRTESLEDEYEELPGGEHICPENHVNIMSSTYITICI